MTEITKRKLLQIKLMPDAYDQLEELKHTSGLSTMTEVIKYSLAVMRWVVEKQKGGFQIYALPADGKEEDGEKIQLLLPL